MLLAIGIAIYNLISKTGYQVRIWAGQITASWHLRHNIPNMFGWLEPRRASLRSGGCVCLLSWQPAAARDPALGYTGDKQYYIPHHAHVCRHTHGEGHCCHSNRGVGGRKKRKRKDEAPVAGKHLRQIRSLSFSLSLLDTFCLSWLHFVATRWQRHSVESKWLFQQISDKED